MSDRKRTLCASISPSGQIALGGEVTYPDYDRKAFVELWSLADRTMKARQVFQPGSMVEWIHFVSAEEFIVCGGNQGDNRLHDRRFITVLNSDDLTVRSEVVFDHESLFQLHCASGIAAAYYRDIRLNTVIEVLRLTDLELLSCFAVPGSIRELVVNKYGNIVYADVNPQSDDVRFYRIGITDGVGWILDEVSIGCRPKISFCVSECGTMIVCFDGKQFCVFDVNRFLYHVLDVEPVFSALPRGGFFHIKADMQLGIIAAEYHVGRFEPSAHMFKLHEDTAEIALMPESSLYASRPMERSPAYRKSSDGHLRNFVCGRYVMARYGWN